MRPVYSVLIAQGTIPLEPATIYTVPLGYTLVMRDLDGIGPNSTNAIILSELTADQNFLAVPAVLTPDPIGMISTYTWRGRQVFSGGQILQWAAYEDLIFARVSGYLLTAT